MEKIFFGVYTHTVDTFIELLFRKTIAIDNI